MFCHKDFELRFEGRKHPLQIQFVSVEIPRSLFLNLVNLHAKNEKSLRTSDMQSATICSFLSNLNMVTARRKQAIEVEWQDHWYEVGVKIADINWSTRRWRNFLTAASHNFHGFIVPSSSADGAFQHPLPLENCAGWAAAFGWNAIRRFRTASNVHPSKKLELRALVAAKKKQSKVGVQ